MKNKNYFKIATIVFFICLLVGSVGIGAVFLEIQRSVEKYITISQKAHPVKDDNVASLIEYINSDKHTLAEKKQAVWALGRIADPRALNVLEGYYTGDECDHDNKLCQYELEKAIKRCRK